jgi:hypothetical protein
VLTSTSSPIERKLTQTTAAAGLEDLSVDFGIMKCFAFLAMGNPMIAVTCWRPKPSRRRRRRVHGSSRIAQSLHLQHPCPVFISLLFLLRSSFPCRQESCNKASIPQAYAEMMLPTDLVPSHERAARCRPQRCSPRSQTQTLILCEKGVCP